MVFGPALHHAWHVYPCCGAPQRSGPSGCVFTIGGRATTKRKRTSTGTPTRTSSARGGARKREVVTPLGPLSETTVLRAWAEGDLGAIAGNIQTIRHHLPRSCRPMSGVKADGHGHTGAPVWRAG